jgi:arginase family enzyme
VLPVYDQLDANTLVIQFDAHLDCYDLHDTTTELCHGNFMMHIDGERPRIVNIGHRDLFLPREAIEKHFHKAFAIDGPWQTVTHDADSIWIDIDVDVFDPMLVPAVRQPQPAGLTPREMLGVLNRLDWSKVKGVSFSEFDPKLDVRDASLNLLGWLMEWVLLKRVE